MKKQKKEVAKLANPAKVDSKEVIITDEMAENFMREKIEKKRGRPKKVSGDLKYLNFNPQLAELKRVSKSIKKATLEEIENFLGNNLELAYPILKQVIKEEDFIELTQSQNAQGVLSSQKVKRVLAEMVKEYTDFTMEFLDKITDPNTSLNEMNQDADVLNKLDQLKEKYNRKLVVEVELFYQSKKPNKKNKFVPIYDLTEEDLAQLPEKETEKFKGIDWTATPTTSRWRPEFISQLKPIEIPKKEERPIESKIENEGDISENPNEEHLDLFSLSITNKSDEKIHKVKIFNYDFKEQKQIKYENLEGMAYSEFLRKLDKVESEKYTIQIIRLVAVCDYKKFQNKQLEAELYYKNKDIFAREWTIPIQPLLYYHPEQEHANIIDIKKSFRLYSNSEFELEYLMPDTTVNLHFFLTKTKTK